MSLYSVIKEWIKNEMIQVLNAPAAFTLTLILGTGLAYIASRWRYGGIVESLPLDFLNWLFNFSLLST